MSWNNKVVWTEGMFLGPQHFQQSVRSFESLIEKRCSNIRSYDWGISELRIDDALLPLGKFSISTISGRLPDGTPINVPDDDDTPLTLEVPENTLNTIVYLALPLKRRDAIEVDSGDNQKSLARFTSEEYEVRNNSSVDSETVPVQVAKLRFKLMLESEDLSAYTYIAVARIIEIRSDKQIVLDDKFIPPALNIHANHYLSGFIKELQGLLHHRGDALGGRVSDAGRGGSAEIADFLLLQVINRYEPLLLHLQNQPIHPESFYQFLIMLAGELATFNTAVRRPTEFPVYLHDNITDTYMPVVRTLRQSLSAVLEQTAVALPLQQHQYGIYTATISDRNLIGKATFVLAVNASIRIEDLQRHFPAQVKAGPAEQIRQLVNLQLPGITLRPLPVAPRQLPYHSGFAYFELDKTNELWKHMTTSGAFAFHIGGEFPGLEMEFWAIKE